MEELETSAKTVEQAIQLALEQLGIGREEAEIAVIKEGKPGILGLGAEEAVIRVRPLVSVPKEESIVAKMAKDVLETLLNGMGISASVVRQASSFVEVEEGADAPIILDIKGDDLGILIGRRGQALACLQHIVRLIVAHQTKDWVPIAIDVEGYKQRRYEALGALALRMAERVKAERVQFALEPMTAYERRIIHLALADHPDVITQSTGVGEMRRVIVVPKAKQQDQELLD